MAKKGSQYLIIIGTLLIFILNANTSQAQTGRIGDFIKAGKHDAKVLAKAYLEPVASGIGGSLNTGWFTSASTHQPLGFDIQIRGSLAFIPSADQSFDLKNYNFERLSPADANATVSPTAGGKSNPGPEVVVKDQGDEVARFNLPQGSGYSFVPAPMIQASVGLIKNTDVIVRYVPEVEIGEYGSFNLRGVGLKHSLSQWIPGHKFFPLDISVMAGFSRIDLSANLELEPPQPDPTTNYDNQKVEATFDMFTAKLIVGKTLPFISVYAAAGYESSTMGVDVVGNYPVQFSGPAGTTMTRTIHDPFSYEDEGENKYSFTGGLSFKLLFFNIFGEYTLSEYSIVNAGIGFSFR